MTKIISAFSMTTKRSTAFILQMASFLGSGTKDRNKVLCVLENHQRLKELDNVTGMCIEEENFILCKSLEDAELREYNIIDYIGHNSDEIYYILEQDWDSINYINEFWKLNKDVLHEIRNNKDKKVVEKLIFLNFIDSKFNEDYFLKFHLPSEMSSMKRHYVEYSKRDQIVEFEDELDSTISILNLSSDRQLKIFSIIDEHMKYKNPKSHLRNIKLDNLKRRFRK